MKAKEFIAEKEKFHARRSLKDKIHAEIWNHLDPERVAGGFTEINFFKHNNKVYVTVEFRYSLDSGSRIGRKIKKLFVLNKDRTLSPVKDSSLLDQPKK